MLEAGAAAYAAGDVAGALHAFQEASRVATGTVRINAMVNAASMSDELGDHRGAIAAYRTALDLIPADAPRLRPAALVNLSQALQHVGDLQGAQAALENARDLLLGSTAEGDLLVACLLSLTAVAIHRQDWARATDLATESLDTAVHFAPELAGHPLLNLAAVNFETGRTDQAVDFAEQALAAFLAADNPTAVAETQQNLGLMFLRTDRLDDAEPLLLTSQAYLERAGIGHRVGIGLKALAFLAEGQGKTERAADFYRRSLDYFQATGAVLDAADVRTRLATLAYSAGDHRLADDHLAAALSTYAERGLGLQCAATDYWHATLLESSMQADPALAIRAVTIAVPAALAIDSVRHSFATGYQRDRWKRRIADPAMALAFRLAYATGDAVLLADLIETQCAGTGLREIVTTEPVSKQIPFDRVDAPVPVGPSAPLHLGVALAGFAASAGLAVARPPKLATTHGRIVLADHIAAAEQRYGLNVRDPRVLKAW